MRKKKKKKKVQTHIERMYRTKKGETPMDTQAASSLSFDVVWNPFMRSLPDQLVQSFFSPRSLASRPPALTLHGPSNSPCRSIISNFRSVQRTICLAAFD